MSCLDTKCLNGHTDEALAILAQRNEVTLQIYAINLLNCNNIIMHINRL